jgi:hypothetical protein
MATIGTIFCGIFPFLMDDMVHIALFVAIPQVVLYLPGFMK